MRSGAVAFIFVTILLDMFALGMIMPILPKLVESFVDNDTASAARIFGLFGTAWALMQFFFSPILGGLSDRFGRRPVVLLSNFGLAFDYVLMALAPSLIWLFVGRVISGITSASVSTAFAYIADITPPERRAAMFGKVGAAFGAGFILGPAIGGLLGGIGPRLPFWAAAGLSFANAVYGLLILPESLPRNRRAPGKTPIRWARCTCCAPTGFLPDCRRRISLRNSPMWCCRVHSCSMRPTVTAGMQRSSASRSPWWAFVRWPCRARRSGRSSANSASAGRCCSGLAAAPSAF
jgi:multidrug resistance protein